MIDGDASLFLLIALGSAAGGDRNAMIGVVAFRRSPRIPVQDDDAPPRMSSDDQRWQDDRDAEENESSRVPDDEQYRMLAVVCVEAYTPSTVDNLVEGVRRLGWVHDDLHVPPFTTLDEWIVRARAAPFGGQCANLSNVLDEDSPPAAGRPLRAPLPGGVESVWATMHQVAPSVTCLVTTFVLDDTLGLAVDRAVRPDRRTQVSRTPSGWAYTGPAQQRADAAVAERRAIRAVCHGWVRDHLPGAFSAGLSRHGAPAIEVFTINGVRPFDEANRHRGGRPDHLFMLHVDTDSDAWTSPSLPGWRLAAWDARLVADPFVMRLGGRWDEVTGDLGGYGGPTASGVSNRLSRTIAPFATRFAVHCLLSGYEEHLAGLRDTAAPGVLARTKVKTDDVDAVRRLLTGVGYDARVIAADLADLCHDRRRYEHEAVDFAPVVEWRAKHTPSMLDALRSSDGSRAANVVAAEATARDTAATTATLLASLVNLRLQRAVVALTIVLLVVAVATLAVAL